MATRARTKPKTTDLLPSEIAELRAIAEEAGYADPYPAPGVAPTADIETDRCQGERCGWTLFVAMDCGVYCLNERCEKYRYDLRQDESDEEEQ